MIYTLAQVLYIIVEFLPICSIHFWKWGPQLLKLPQLLLNCLSPFYQFLFHVYWGCGFRYKPVYNASIFLMHLPNLSLQKYSISGNSFLLKSGGFFDINIAISLVIGSVLFNFHIFVTFPNLLLLFISNFIPWLSENILSVISSLLNLSGLVSQPSCGLSCRISHVHLRRPFILLGGVFYRFLLGLVG